MPLRRRVFWTLVAFLVSLVVSAFYYQTSDFYFPICGGRALLNGENPYDYCPTVFYGRLYPQNPMTTILAAIPYSFAGTGPGSLYLFATISALLVYGILTNGKPWQLLIFTSAAYWEACRLLQWSPLMAAIMFLPGLLPLTLVKPQIGLPVALSHLTKRRIALCTAFGLLSVVIMPSWPGIWLRQALATYDGRPMVSYLPFGLLLLLPALRWRDPRARFLLMMGLVPVRHLYDLTALWTIPRTSRQMIALSLCSWLILAVSRLLPVYRLETSLAIFTLLVWLQIQSR